MLLFIFQTRRQAGAQALTCILRKTVQTGRYVAARLLQLAGQVLRIYTQPRRQLSLKRRDGAPCEGDGNQHLHQKRDTKGNEYGSQQATA